jgi:hypothetical protein
MFILLNSNSTKGIPSSEHVKKKSLLFDENTISGTTILNPTAGHKSSGTIPACPRSI